MDIFTTQLAKVAPNKIEVDKLRIKAVAKEARLHEIKDDVQELDPDASNKQQGQTKQEHEKQEEAENKKTDSNIIDEDGHLDIYV